MQAREDSARCDECPLKGGIIVPPKPSVDKLRLILVGEGPGRKEENLREPFVGPSGALLDQTLDQAGIKRSSCYVTNATLCRAENEKDNELARQCCAPRLLKELAELPSDVPIVTLGKLSTASVLGINSIQLSRGFVWTARDMSGPAHDAELLVNRLTKKGQPSTKEARRLAILQGRGALAGRTVFPTIHPAFVLRNELWRPVLDLDFARVGRWLRGELTKATLADQLQRTTIQDLSQGAYVTVSKPDEVELSLSKLGSVVAVDIETETRTHPLEARILCVGVSDGSKTVVVIPWDKSFHAHLLTNALLAKEHIVFHNGYNFDQMLLERDGVALRPEALEDTLLAHHAFASHYPQKLDQVISEFVDASPWKIRFGRRGGEEKGAAPMHMPPDELAFYNACDARLTVLAWHKMQPDLETERWVYAHDKQLAMLCKEMQINGIGLDSTRRQELLDELDKLDKGLVGEMVRFTWSGFNPSAPANVRKALFEHLRAPIVKLTETGIPSTNEETLEILKATGEPSIAGLCALLLKWRVIVKVRATYVLAAVPLLDKRLHYNWKSYGTVSGRMACRLQSCPRWANSPQARPREMYAAPEGKKLVYFDLSQAEMRFAAYLSGDANFIKTCEGDVHVGNALVLFPKAEERLLRDPKGKRCPRHSDGGDSKAGCNCGKEFRDIAKNAGFAVSYMAEKEKVYGYLRSKGFEVTLRRVDEMLTRLRLTYRQYYRYVDENVAFVRKHGYLRTAILGRVRYFGFYPKPTEIANYPIQSGIADIMNVRLVALAGQMPQSATLVMQVHDSATYEVLDSDVGSVEDAIRATWAVPVELAPSIVCREARGFVLPVDIKTAERWSAL